MATVRQPFAPLDGARLQNLTSIKNRQNAASPPSAGKRKADLLDIDNFENVDPVAFTKRSKGSNSEYIKPSNFILKRAAATPLPEVFSLSSPTKPTASPRRTLQPKSPINKLNTASVAKSSPIVAPAGRSPTHGKRSGLLGNRRRASGPFTRIDPPAFGLGGAAPFSLDAALKGTIPSYTPRQKIKGKGKARQSLDSSLGASSNANWFFEIHEDTPEQEMTNLLQHSTCVLDISSDEETEQRSSREDGLDKENVPPPGDVSQTSARRVSGDIDDMIVEKQRTALGEMDAAEFYPEGVDASSVIYVPADDDEEAETPIINDFEFAPLIKNAAAAPLPAQDEDEIDFLMAKPTDYSSKAAVLQPIEGTGDSFDLWESESAHDDEAEAAVAVSA